MADKAEVLANRSGAAANNDPTIPASNNCRHDVPSLRILFTSLYRVGIGRFLFFLLPTQFHTSAIPERNCNILYSILLQSMLNYLQSHFIPINTAHSSIMSSSADTTSREVYLLPLDDNGVPQVPRQYIYLKAPTNPAYIVRFEIEGTSSICREGSLWVNIPEPGMPFRRDVFRCYESVI